MRGHGGQIVKILDDLALMYTPAGVGVWLFARHQLLDGQRPVDLLRAGEIERVMQAVPDVGQVAT